MQLASTNNNQVCAERASGIEGALGGENAAVPQRSHRVWTGDDGEGIN